MKRNKHDLRDKEVKRIIAECDSIDRNIVVERKYPEFRGYFVKAEVKASFKYRQFSDALEYFKTFARGEYSEDGFGVPKAYFDTISRSRYKDVPDEFKEYLVAHEGWLYSYYIDIDLMYYYDVQYEARYWTTTREESPELKAREVYLYSLLSKSEEIKNTHRRSYTLPRWCRKIGRRKVRQRTKYCLAKELYDDLEFKTCRKNSGYDHWSYF